MSQQGTDQQTDVVVDERVSADVDVVADGVLVDSGPALPVSDDPGSGALREMFMIALPSVATMASHTIMQFSDKFMVSRIGPEPVYVAAQSNGGILVWTLCAFMLGMTGVVNSFVSQNYGAGKPERGAAYAWNGLWLGLAYCGLLIVPAIMLVPTYFGRIHSDETLVGLETTYATIMLMGAVWILSSRTVHHFFYGLHRPWVVFISAIIANVLNVMLNVTFIFGDQQLVFENGGWIAESVVHPITGALSGLAGSLGIEPMGLAGAAWATVIGSFVEFAIPMALFVGPKYARELGTLKAWKLSAVCLRGLARVGTVPGLMFVNEIVCWNMLMVWLVPMGGKARAAYLGLDEAAVEQAGTIANTAGWIGLQYMHLSFMPAIGLSIACQAMVGKAMGMRRPDIATKRAMLALKITMGYMGLCALVFVLFRADLMAVFIDAQTSAEDRAKLIGIGSKVMIAAAVFQVFDALAITASAALRGAGDTLWPGVATIVLSWTCIVGVGWSLVHFVPSLGSLGPWIGASLYIVMLGIVLGARFAQGKWKSLSLVEDGSGPDLDPFDDVIPDPTMTADV